MAPGLKEELVKQFRRQTDWLKQHYSYLLGTHVIEKRAWKALPKALDVGCGPGIVMEELSRLIVVQGVDIDPDWVSMCRAKGLDVLEGKAEELPFEDDEFDVVYCSWVMMWLKDPVLALKEMARVSKGWVICLAEPDYGSRIDHPEELVGLRDIMIDGIREMGGEPLMGRKLMALFTEAGLKATVGIHPGHYDKRRLEQELEHEWGFLKEMAGKRMSKHELADLKRTWDKALKDGVLFQFSPTFYAIGTIH